MSNSLRFLLLRGRVLHPKSPAPLRTGRSSSLWPCFGAVCHSRRSLSTSPPLITEDKVTVHFINRDGKRISVNSVTGLSLLDVVVKENLEFEGFGACEGTMACTTCHLIFEEATYNKLGSIADEEMDMLDLTCGLTATSRLGCQVYLSKALDGMIVRVPDAVTDARKSNDKDSAPEATPQ